MDVIISVIFFDCRFYCFFNFEVIVIVSVLVLIGVIVLLVLLYVIVIYYIIVIVVIVNILYVIVSCVIVVIFIGRCYCVMVFSCFSGIVIVGWGFRICFLTCYFVCVVGFCVRRGVGLFVLTGFGLLGVVLFFCWWGVFCFFILGSRLEVRLVFGGFIESLG